jgi:SAM-dependent methyltransferase
MRPKLYSSLAEWWPLLSPHTDYEEEAEIYREHLRPEVSKTGKLTLLELGSGGGCNAFYLKRWFDMTLADLSLEMLRHSQGLNPECEHLEGDMRTLRLGRQFDRVFIHDAICYMTTSDDLRRALETVFAHCRPGGLALFAPDWVRETFVPGSEHGGSDGEGRSLRYLEWTWDADPSDSKYVVDYVYALREADGALRVEHDRHVEGIFSRGEWLQSLGDAGFEEPRVELARHSEVERPLELFIGTKPGPLAREHG